jgi:hypothetical protein
MQCRVPLQGIDAYLDLFEEWPRWMKAVALLLAIKGGLVGGDFPDDEVGSPSRIRRRRRP